MRARRWALLTALIGSGCTSGAPAGRGPTTAPVTAPLGPLSARQVEQSLDARPSLPAAAKVAYFTLDPELAPEIEALLSRSRRVASVHRIPSIFVTGRRTFDQGSDLGRPVDTELLRRLAASAGADALLVVDYAARSAYDPNGLAALSVILLPVLFLPLQDASAESYLDGVLFDTRTGRELGQVHATRKGDESFVTVYSDAADQLRHRQRRELIDEAGQVLGAILDGVPHPPPSVVEEVALPSDTTDPWAEPRHLRIRLVEGGGVTLEGQRLDSLAAFVGSLRRHIERGPTVATLFAGSSVSHARVVEILELIRRIGIRDVRIETAPAGEPRDATTEVGERATTPPAETPEQADRYGF